MNLEDAAKISASFVAGGGIFAIFAKRILKSLVVTGTETDLISRMHNEVTRLSDQNDKLAKMVNELQLEVFQVRRENAELRTMMLQCALPIPETTPAAVVEA
jgi:acetolactate synthase small subunit